MYLFTNLAVFFNIVQMSDSGKNRFHQFLIFIIIDVFLVNGSSSCTQGGWAGTDWGRDQGPLQPPGSHNSNYSRSIFWRLHGLVLSSTSGRVFLMFFQYNCPHSWYFIQSSNNQNTHGRWGKSHSTISLCYVAPSTVWRDQNFARHRDFFFQYLIFRYWNRDFFPRQNF